MDTNIQTPQAERDEFDAAFAELEAGTPPAAAPVAEAPAADPVVPAAETPPAEVTPPAEAPPAEITPPAAAEPAAPTVAPEVAAQLAELQARLDAYEKPAPAPEAPPAPTEPPPLYTAEEQAILDKYNQEWPDVSRGEALIRRGEYAQVVRFIFDQLAPQLAELADLRQAVDRTSTRTQYDEIVDLVPDYDDVRDATLAWIDTQPAYLKAAYQNVANTGTPQDVADLITRFKRETNYAAPAASTPAAQSGGTPPAGVAPAAPVAPAAASPAPNASLPAAAAAAAASLKPVKTGRSEPVSAPDPNDFDAAFAEYAKAAN